MRSLRTGRRFGSCCGRMGAGRVTSWGEGGGEIPAPVFTGDRLYTGTTEGGMGPRPPSSRGQDLDARTTRGRATRFLDSVRCARNDMWSGEEEGDGFPPVSLRG